MKKMIPCLLLAGSCLAFLPRHSDAGSDKYWWGAGGLLVGSTVGYFAGKEYHRPYEHDRVYYRNELPRRHDRVYVRRGLPAMRSPGYYKESRFWPVYRHVEHYPIATNERLWGEPQAVSNLDLRRDEPEETSEQDDRGDISINIGDSNSDVEINIGETRFSEETGDSETERVAVPSGIGKNGDRMVDVPASDVKKEEETSASGENQKPEDSEK